MKKNPKEDNKRKTEKRNRNYKIIFKNNLNRLVIITMRDIIIIGFLKSTSMLSLRGKSKHKDRGTLKIKV